MKTPILTGAAVTEAVRSAHSRKDMEAMRSICGGTPDEILTAIGSGDMEIRGDSREGFEIWTIDRDYLVPTEIEGRKPIPKEEWVEVTGKSDRVVERIERGILINMSDSYFVDHVSVAGERQ